MLKLNIQQFGGRGQASSNRKAGYLVINEMVERDIKALKKEIEDYREERNKSFHNWYDARIENYPDLSEEEFRNMKKDLYAKHMSFKRDHRGLENLSNMTNERVEKTVKDHYKSLQAKVEKKIGTIKYITKTGNNGYDYRMENAKGESVGVRVVGAGGYNIQRYHTRWVIVK